MARTGAVWGIDIGQCALKALRCRSHESDPEQITAEDFDYIEYAKILSQPEADTDTLVRDALKQFLSQHEVVGDRVAMSVSGQSGLARFIKLPPVESKKIPDIVKYEARQQIPFALEDVVWDYQQMAGGSVEEGFALETEVGLFAMKRDQVYRLLKPLTDLGIGVDFVQLTPLAIFNFAAFDLLHDLPPAEQYDPDNPPPSTVVVSLGTDTTDLVVTNGYRVWQRSIPIGGSHFTKALTKELRLTFSKAEHLKRNATKAEDPKAVFQAMRPVFGDLVAEIDRSLGYFTGIDRSATVGNVVATGNALKLPGLKRYLSDNLKHEVQAITSFRGLAGDAVISDPKFKDNQLSFGVSYGLCLQGLGRAKIRTNLLPHEIVTERLVREKKPWAVAAVAAITVGCAISFYGYYSAWQSVDVDRDDFQAAIREAAGAEQRHGSLLSANTQALEAFTKIDTIGKNLVSNVEGRLLWLELFKAIDAVLPYDDPPDEKPEKIAERNELHIETLECEKFDELSTWFTPLAATYAADYRGIYGRNPGQSEETETAAAAPLSAAPPPTSPPLGGGSTSPLGGGAGADGGPSGPGWVIELQGYHYHNDKSTPPSGGSFVRATLIKNLHEVSVRLPDGPDGSPADVPIKDLGIGYPLLFSISPMQELELADPSEDPVRGQRPMMDDEEGFGGGRRPAPQRDAVADAAEADLPEVQKVRRVDFVVQFCWTETPPSARVLIAQQRAKEAAAAEAAGGDGGEAAQVATAENATREE